MPPPLSRRKFLATFGLGGAAFAAGCSGGSSNPPAAFEDALGILTEEPALTPTPAATATSTPTPAPTPTPTARPQGTEERLLMAGTQWETPFFINSSGLDGPALVVLGGVHGNEPGGWMAAVQTARWKPSRGVLAVLPRANELAILRFQRERDGEGDLNRMYPGDPDSELPMSRLAAEVTALAAELRTELLLDLHESWAFFVDRQAAGFQNRQQAGTAYLGQTITAGPGPRAATIASQMGEILNGSITRERELMVIRDGTPFGRNDSPTGQQSGRGRSSLSLGGHIPGLTPVLVEMGQQGQDIDRRTELHIRAVQAAMQVLEMPAV
jgi:hypothetical protein